MTLIALILFSALSFGSEDLRITSSFEENGEDKELIIKSHRPVMDSEERLRIYEYMEVLSYSSCGGKELYPEISLQEALPSQESFSSVRRVFQCRKLDKKSAKWFKTFISGSCKKENLFQAMEKVCLKYKK